MANVMRARYASADIVPPPANTRTDVSLLSVKRDVHEHNAKNVDESVK
jgi:hypothetical protein